MTSKACPRRYDELLQSLGVQTTAGQTAAAQASADETAASETAAVQASVDETAASQTIVVQASAVQTAAELRYDDPRAIYQRYVEARHAWYKAQPRGYVRTNQQYRRAIGLPLRYDKASYQWCLDYKQMGERCRESTGSRVWEKEEMMAYLDWSKAEEDRVEARVAAEMAGNPFSGRRGMGDIWEAAARDIEEQEALYSGRQD